MEKTWKNFNQQHINKSVENISTYPVARSTVWSRYFHTFLFLEQNVWIYVHILLLLYGNNARNDSKVNNGKKSKYLECPNIFQICASLMPMLENTPKYHNGKS